jgi:ATP-dependent Clp protease ATP-binding subunit ClpA
MFETFDRQCHMAFVYAQDEAKRLGAKQVCAPQILLGISRMMGTDVAAAVVLSGFKPQEVRLELERELQGKAVAIATEIQWTNTAKTIVQAAVKKARERSAMPHVSLVDLLMAVLENPDDLLVDVVINSGTHWGMFREEVRKRLKNRLPSAQENLFSCCEFPGLELDPASSEALLIARSEAQSNHCDVLATEHILLGLIQADGLIRQSLSEAGVQLGSIRKRIRELREANNDKTTSENVQSQASTQVKSVCQCAAMKAKEDSKVVAVRHILLAILTVDCTAKEVLNMDASQISAVTQRLTKTEVPDQSLASKAEIQSD